MPDQEKKQLRNFGLVVGGVFLLIGLWPALFRQQSIRVWAVGLSIALIAPALVAPHSLRHVHRAWMALGHYLGWINTKVILFVIFYGLFTPIGIMKRWLGRDSMCRKFEPESETYQIPRSPRDGSHLTRQF